MVPPLRGPSCRWSLLPVILPPCGPPARPGLKRRRSPSSWSRIWTRGSSLGQAPADHVTDGPLGDFGCLERACREAGRPEVTDRCRRMSDTLDSPAAAGLAGTRVLCTAPAGAAPLAAVCRQRGGQPCAPAGAGPGPGWLASRRGAARCPSASSTGTSVHGWPGAGPAASGPAGGGGGEAGPRPGVPEPGGGTMMPGETHPAAPGPAAGLSRCQGCASLQQVRRGARGAWARGRHAAPRPPLPRWARAGRRRRAASWLASQRSAARPG